MSNYNQLYTEPNGQLNRNIMQVAGAIIPIEITIPNALAEFRTQNKESLPTPISGLALIDTGATISAVEKEIIESLGVKSVGTTSTSTANGVANHFLYPAKFRFPTINDFEFDFNSITGVEFGGYTIDNQKVVALLGRDVLSTAIFIYNGTLGLYSLSF